MLSSAYLTFLTAVGNVRYHLFLFLPAFYFLWLIVFTKKLLFWVWLWQIKEYHIGRFIDHFRTEKGKKIVLNYLSLAKLISLFGLIFFFSIFVFVVFFIFFGEALAVFYRLFKKTIKYPVLTPKTILILATGFFVEIYILLFFFWGIPKPTPDLFLVGLLSLDILAPAIFSHLVFLFQPFTVLLRDRIIEKAKRKREKFKDLIVIGITGSYGKTSTKEFLHTILASKFGEKKVLKTKEHQNSEVGISQCILNELKPEHEVFVCEMGAYNLGGIKLLCEIAKPKIGVITGINEQHLALFGNMENLISAEGGIELLQALPRDGVAIFNGNSQVLMPNVKVQMSNINLKSKIFISTKEKLDLWAGNIKAEKEWLNFKVCSGEGESADFKVNLLGTQNIENILLASACAKELGMSLNEISKACEKIKPEQGAMKLFKTKLGFNVIDSSYSANPNGVLAHLEYLKMWEGKKIIVMPCLIELGKTSAEVHRKIGEQIGKVCDLAIITTKDKFKEIKETAIKSGMKENNILFLESSKEIFEKIKPYLGPENVILLESRVPKKLIELLTK